MTADSNSARYGPIPLVFGVTGHRDLISEDVRGLEAAVRQVFQAVQSRYPHSPLRLLSPLAEGADRLAARVALQLGGELLVPLPMPRQEYLRDFATLESRQEFERLLARLPRYLNCQLHLSPTPSQYPNRRVPVIDITKKLAFSWCVIVISCSHYGTGKTADYPEGRPQLCNSESPVYPPNALTLWTFRIRDPLPHTCSAATECRSIRG